jgi:uncharacterized protein YidB (DUF937 family)
MAGIGDSISGLIGSGNAEVQKLLGPLTEMIESTGGLGGLVEKLKGAGLGDQVSSWVGTGENAKIDPSKLTEVLGPDHVKALAEKAGTSVEQVQSSLSEVLPTLIDKLSPGGQLPGADQATELLKKVPGAEGIADKLGGLLGGGGAAPEAPAAPAS